MTGDDGVTYDWEGPRTAGPPRDQLRFAVGLFKPYERAGAASQPSPEPTPDVVAGPVKKQVPTPTRKQAEEARRQRLHPTPTKKEARALDRQARNSRRDEQLQKVEGQPGKVLLRDHIDSRKGISGWAMPILMVSLMISLVAASFGEALAAMATWFTWSAMALIIVDLVVMWRSYKRLHAERLPKEPLKGLLAYAINRSVNLRRLRMPAPRVKPGDQI